MESFYARMETFDARMGSLYAFLRHLMGSSGGVKCGAGEALGAGQAVVSEAVILAPVVVPELPVLAPQVDGEVDGGAGVHEGRRVHGEAVPLSDKARLTPICVHTQSLRVHVGEPVIEGVTDSDLFVVATGPDTDQAPHVKLGDGDLLQADV